MDNYVSSLKGWLNKPFDESMSAVDWFLFVGLMLAIIWLWSRIIVRITR